jgi:hypothetical protein
VHGLARAPLIRAGDGPAAAVERLQWEQAELRRTIDRAKAIVDAPELDSRRVSRATAAGDEARLRGLPAVGRGCGGGAIRGTRPGDSLW